MLKLTVLTTSQADYGLLEKLINRIHNDSECELCLIVSGSHLSPEFGSTVKYIKAPISARVEVLISSDTNTAVSKSIGLGCLSFTDVFENEKPDWLIVLGDRFETLSAVVSAYCLNIPICHISGGEITQGSLDDAFRHCITKLSYLHFVYTEEYRKRVVQLGEHPDRVFNVGCISLEGVGKYWSSEKEDYYLVSWHPETNQPEWKQKADISTLLSFLVHLKEPIYFCHSKGDSGSREINRLFKKFCKKYPKNKVLDLDRNDFLEYLGKAQVLIGNSSAGIYEAPVLGTPVINVGTRQAGRIKANSIIDSECTPLQLKASFGTIFSEWHEENMKNIEVPYRGGEVSRRILDIIKRTRVIDLQKGFYDVA
ncbi:MAG: UDP-N-acetylglucosamine 2-epimerase [Promethearchaeota archaeon]|jgi:UDP-hydrolysing UDP-N-acetyl-D-glucosamine 2-epimerase